MVLDLNPSGGTGKNVIIFGVDMSSITKIDNRKKYILIHGEGLTQGLELTLTLIYFTIQLILLKKIQSFA